MGIIFDFMLTIIVMSLLMDVHCNGTMNSSTNSSSLSSNIMLDPNIRNGNENEIYDYTMNEKPVELDGFKRRQFMLSIINYNSLTYNCRVKRLMDRNVLTEAKICFKDKLKSTEICKDVVLNVKTTTTTITKIGRLHFNVTSDVRTGFSVTLSKRLVSNLNGYLSCFLKNNVDEITSNLLEIHNFKYYEKLEENARKPIESVRLLNFSNQNVFECGQPMRNVANEKVPNWIKPTAKMFYFWLYCKEYRYGMCGNLIWQGLKQDDDFEVMSNDSVKIFPHAFQNRSRLTIQCVNPAGRIMATYVISGTYKEQSKKIRALSPPMQTVNIREGKIGVEPYEAVVLYHPMGSFIHEWTMNREALQNKVNTTAHRLIFPRLITDSSSLYRRNQLRWHNKQSAAPANYNPKEDLSGVYRLDVYQVKDKFADYDRRTFKIEVNTMRPPVAISNSESNIQYVMADSGLRLNLVVLGSKKGSEIYLNEQKLKMDSMDNSRVHQTYPYLKGMWFSVNQTLTKARTQYWNKEYIQYESQNIQGLQFSEGYSHRLMVVSRNDIGELRQQTRIKVFEKPRWIEPLSKFRCTTDCFSDSEHEFKCSIYEKKYKKFGIEIEYRWFINNVNIDVMYSKEDKEIYFETKNDRLLIRSISSNDTIRDMKMVQRLRNATVSCSVEMTVNRIEDKRTYRRLMYNSHTDNSTREYTVTSINLVDPTTVIGRTRTFVLMVCVPIMIMTAITSLGVLIFCLRKTGASYYDDGDNVVLEMHQPNEELEEHNQVLEEHDQQNEEKEKKAKVEEPKQTEVDVRRAEHMHCYVNRGTSSFMMDRPATQYQYGDIEFYKHCNDGEMSDQKSDQQQRQRQQQGARAAGGSNTAR